MYDKRKSSVSPFCDDIDNGKSSETPICDDIMMEERANPPPLHLRVQEAAKTAWSGENVVVAISDILGPNARKEWNIPVGSHKNPFWRLTKSVSSPQEMKKVLTKSLTVCCTMGSAPLVKNLLESGADPNEEPGKWGPLHSAAYSGNPEIMRVLLEDPRTCVDRVEDKGMTALHVAARKGNCEALKIILGMSNIDVNAADEAGHTALHIAGASPLRGEVSEVRFLQCISLLMDRADLKLNKPDKEGLSALSKTIMYSHKEFTKAMLKHKNGHNFNLDTFLAGYYGKTIRDAIIESYPELIPDLPNPIQENINSPSVATRLLAALQKDDFSTFQSLLKNKKQVFHLNHWYDEPYHCTIIEMACQIMNRVKFIAELLKAGANPNTLNPITSQSLLHLAARRGNTAALKLFLRLQDVNVNIKDSSERTPLHCLARVHCKNEEDSKNLQECINLLVGEINSTGDTAELPSQKPNLNATTKTGETALHIAARMGEKETILTLLRRGADVLFRTSALKPPLFYIDPSVIESYLDECIESNEESPMHEDYCLIFNYNFLHSKDNSNDNNKRGKRDPEMPILKYISETSRLKHLLKHPVIHSFIALKINRMRHFHTAHCLFYSLFLGILTWHCLLLGKDGEEQDTLEYKISLSLLSILLLLFILSEVQQFITSPKTYTKHYLNWLFLLVILMSSNVCVDTVVTIIPQCTSMALMLAWCYFVLGVIGGFPILSIQIQMLKTVAWTFLQYILCYSPLFLAFGICFFTMFRYSGSDKDDFFSATFGMSMLKTFIMFAGEFEASDIPFGYAPYTSHIVFTLFVFLIAIVLLNLLNGLAVSDAQTITRDAEILSLISSVKFIYYVEQMYQNKLSIFSVLDKLPGMKLRIFPNKKEGKAEVNGMTVQNTKIDDDIVQQAISILANKTKENPSNSTLSGNRNELSEKILDIEKSQQKMNNKLNEITKQLDFLHKANRDSLLKMNEILSALGTSPRSYSSSQ